MTVLCRFLELRTVLGSEFIEGGGTKCHSTELLKIRHGSCVGEQSSFPLRKDCATHVVGLLRDTPLCLTHKESMQGPFPDCGPALPKVELIGG